MLNGQTRVRGESRTYLMQVPANYQASRAYPLIFVFHGAGGNGRQAYGWGLQNAAGAADNAIFVYPDAITFQHYGIGWDDGPDGHDLPFFDGMLKDIEATRCIDTSRVFAAGFSWGGDFVITLACHRGDVIRAVAANSTDDEYNDTKDYRTYQGLPCRSHQHPPVRFEHAQGGDTEYPPPDFATTSKLFQYLNSCGGGSVPAKSSSRAMSCVSFQSCASEYTECIFDAHIGHTLPPNWAADTWDFLSRF
jgi:poly(3-hydroxybutyrate) depolymerase